MTLTEVKAMLEVSHEVGKLEEFIYKTFDVKAREKGILVDVLMVCKQNPRITYYNGVITDEHKQYSVPKDIKESIFLCVRHSYNLSDHSLV